MLLILCTAIILSACSVNEQTEQNLDVLSKMNREKDRIEEKIRKRKKELGMSLIYNKK